jgi:phage protein D
MSTDADRAPGDVDAIAATLAETSTTGLGPARGAPHLRPVWRVTVNGQDVSARIAPRLVSLSITDNRTQDADEVEVVVSDHDGRVQLPGTGDTLTVAIGWMADRAGAPAQAGAGDFPLGMVDKGSYTIQSVEYSGAPDTITLRAHAANFMDGLRQLRDVSYHQTTVGRIVTAIAQRNGLPHTIDKAVGARKVKHADQAAESDASFLRRLAHTYDCIATVKAGTLLFSQKRLPRTPSGKPLPPVLLVRADGDQHRYARADRDAYSGVRCWYHDPKTAKRSAVVAGISGRAKDLRITYASQADALAAARAEWARIQRGIYSFEITLAHGRADIGPQRPVVVRGYKPQIDRTPWLVTAVRHALTAGGYTSTLTLETLQAVGAEGGDEAGDAGDE